MIEASNAKMQQLILPSTNKALARVLQELSPQKFAELSKAKDLSSILDTLFKNSSNELQNQKLLELLKNNPTLKELGNIKTTIKDLLFTLQNTKQNLPIEKHLQNMLEHIKNIDDKTLKTKLENSGVFLESKLKQNTKVQELIANDFKAALLKTKAEVQNITTPNQAQLNNLVDKLTLQIDYYQLASHLSNGSALYIPYDFDALEDGNLQITKDQNETYFCDINLTLKEYGELDIRLGLFEKKYLNININTQNEELKTLLLSGLKELKQQLSATGLIIKDIRFLDPSQHYADPDSELKLGFEVKI
ncbi:MAG: flagellar hook-length control protein FliK [Sulfurimonas sp.]